MNFALNLSDFHKFKPLRSFRENKSGPFVDFVILLRFVGIARLLFPILEKLIKFAA
jgi:hypothetical protein